MKKMKLQLSVYYNKLKKICQDLWYKHVTKPRLLKKERKTKELEIKVIHHNFEEKFGVSSAAIKEQMLKLDNGYKKLGQTDNAYLTAKLIEGRQNANYQKLNSCSNAPTMVDWDAITIHNEYFANNEGPSLSEVMTQHSQEGKEAIKKQEDKIRFENLPTVTKEKLKRILRGR